MAITTRRQQAPASVGTAVSQRGEVTLTADWRDPRYQAFALLRLAFTIAPIAFGVDKSPTSWCFGRSTLRRGSTTSRPAQPNSSCMSTAPLRYSLGPSSH